ncbi:MAG TPA: sulfite exporter TauE/SafE family protein [Burkholderiales bacterium]|nr:sulfite exporter TauE/SafE family protein [Burkholderiales bacterium]
MDALSVPELVFFCLVIIVSYAIRGSAGFGGVTVPLLAWVMSLKTVVPMVTFLGILSSAAILRTEYKYIVWRDLWRVMPWCIVGVAAGLYFFKVLDSRTLAKALGMFVIAYGLYSFWSSNRPSFKVRLPMFAITPTAGATAGFVGTIFGSMAGMFFAIYLDLLKHAKNEFRATVAGILLGLGLFRGAGYISVGAFDREALIACAIALPMMAVGVFIGNRVHANLTPVAFRRLVAVILIASGVPLLVR